MVRIARAPGFRSGLGPGSGFGSGFTCSPAQAAAPEPSSITLRPVLVVGSAAGVEQRRRASAGAAARATGRAACRAERANEASMDGSFALAKSDDRRHPVPPRVLSVPAVDCAEIMSVMNRGCDL